MPVNNPKKTTTKLVSKSVNKEEQKKIDYAKRFINQFSVTLRQVDFVTLIFSRILCFRI